MKNTLCRFLAGLTRHTNPDVIEETIYYVNQYLPSGSGFNNGTKFNVDKSTMDKLVFDTSFHHMDQHGYYTKWTEHRITVTPSFYGANIKVSGRNHNDIKEYIAECFDHVLSEPVGEGLQRAYVAIAKSKLRESIEEFEEK